MAVNSIQAATQVPKTEEYQKVQPQQAQPVPEKPREEPDIKQQEQVKSQPAKTGIIDTFA